MTFNDLSNGSMISPFPISPAPFFLGVVYVYTSTSLLIFPDLDGGPLILLFLRSIFKVGPRTKYILVALLTTISLGLPPSFARLTSFQIPSLITCSATNQRCKRDGGP